MKNTVFALIAAGSIVATPAAFADHNSVWGAGWANMPNDIHNTRIEDDNETFLDLVQQGGGADSVNRYDDGDDTTTRSMSSRTTMRGSGSGAARASGMGRGGYR
ncbi:MAG: hypothetical protein AB1450_10590 [Pseudomonadota bacterium]